jgi:hypothetical protein
VRSKVLILIFSVFAAHLTAFSQPASATVPTAGLITDLRAGKSGSFSGSGSTWTDLSGNGNNAILQSTPTWSSTSGGRFALDGSDHFTLPAGMANFASGLTISAYVNFGNVGTWERIVDFGNGSQSNNFLFARFGSNNELTFEVYNGATSLGHCRIVNGILENTWATYAVTVDGTTCNIYRNGSAIFTSAYTALPQNISRSFNYIGRSNWGSDAYFDNGIAALAIYNRALGSAEIATLSAAQIDQVNPALTSSSTFSPAENQSIAASLSANESVSWSILSSTDSARFAINASTGQLTFLATPNFESPIDVGANNVYNLNVRMTDGGGNTSDVALTITVTDVLDTSAFTTFSVNNIATYRSAVTITAVVSVSSRVTFRARNIVIPGCKNKIAAGSGSSFSTTCSWRPSTRGDIRITATSTPVNLSISGAVAPVMNVRVGNRSGSRS